MLVASMVIYWVMWLSFSAVLNAYSWDTMFDRVVSYEDYSSAVMIELTTYCAACSVLLLLAPLARWRPDIPGFHPLNRLDNMLVTGAIGLYVLSLLFQLFAPLRDSIDYLDQNVIDASNPYGSSSAFVIMLPVCLAVLYAYVMVGDAAKGAGTNATTIAAWLVIILDMLARLAIGGRFLPLIPVFVVLLRHFYAGTDTRREVLTLAWIVARGRNTLIVGALIVATTVVTVVLPALRDSGSVNAQKFVDRSAEVSHIGVFFRELLFHVRLKCDTIYYSSALAFTRQSPEHPYRVYEGAVFAVVPRFLWPQKPITGSITGDEYGLCYRLAARALGMGDSGNVPLSPATISYWLFGRYGMAIQILVWSIYLFFLNFLLRQRSFVYLCCAIYIICIPTFITVYASPEALIVMMERVGCFVAAYMILLRVLGYHRRKRPGPVSFGQRRASTQAFEIASGQRRPFNRNPGRKSSGDSQGPTPGAAAADSK
ncbi:MAG: hypothetical protein Q7N50_11310 [Armatimonadota bacterium]|nr:hypothetical protein [Armatimonadota bacterium]